MNLTNPKVDDFLAKAKKWQQESYALRKIILDCGLTEEFKWWQPCYTFQNKNIVLIGGFKEYCVLLFFQGALLKDSAGILSRIGENTQAGRQMRFTSLREIKKMEPIVKAYIHEAILAQEAGLKVKLNKSTELNFPEELQIEFRKNPAFKKAFKALTPGRQRAYNFYFSAPKQSKTRTSRIEKFRQHILNGKGFNDQ
jgi:uncharacterized protein YdeI (YjbR/CyaY-like superfamily)